MQKQAAFERQPAAGAEADLIPLWLLLRVEGIAVAVAAIILYARLDYNWWLFAGLVVAPDLSMLGFLAGNRTGAMVYNVFHTYAAPAIVALIGFAADEPTLQAIAVIWAVHIGVDRTIGYGLKYARAFKDTHIQRV